MSECMDLPAIKARLDARSSEWGSVPYWHGRPDGEPSHALQISGDVIGVAGSVLTPMHEEDIEFIAHAPTDIAALIEEVERLRKLIPPDDAKVIVPLSLDSCKNGLVVYPACGMYGPPWQYQEVGGAVYMEWKP